MPVLNIHRRELFAQLLFQGYSAVKAYEKAGYRRHDGNACTLAHHPEVLARLKEIRGGLSTATGLPVGTNAIAAKANVTVESLMEQAEEILANAMEGKQYSAAVSALKEKVSCPASASSGLRLAAPASLTILAMTNWNACSTSGSCSSATCRGLMLCSGLKRSSN